MLSRNLNIGDLPRYGRTEKNEHNAANFMTNGSFKFASDICALSVIDNA